MTWSGLTVALWIYFYGMLPGNHRVNNIFQGKLTIEMIQTSPTVRDHRYWSIITGLGHQVIHSYVCTGVTLLLFHAKRMTPVSSDL